VTAGGYSSASATIDTHRGTVHAAWQHGENGPFTLNVTVPMGSTAEVHVPKLHGDATRIAEADTLIWSASAAEVGASDGVSEAGDDGRFVRYTTLSGRYVFTVTDGSAYV